MLPRRDTEIPPNFAEHERAEAALRASVEKYRTLFNSIDEGFCTIEVLFDDAGKAVDYRFLETNPAFERQTGLIGVAGKCVSELAPAHEEFWFETYGHIAKTGEARRFEHRADALTPPRIFDVYAFCTGSPGENKLAVLFNDITARRATEEAVRQSEERFRLFVTASSDIVYRMNADWSGMLLLEGKRFLTDTVNPRTNWLDAYIPDHEKEMVQTAIAAAIRTKSTFELEHRVIRVDGSAGWAFSRAIPLLNERGDIVEWFGTARDITERKLAEQALRLSEGRLQRMVNVPRVGVLTFNFAGRLLAANDAFLEMTGYTRADFEAREFTWRDFTPPEFVSVSEEVMQSLHATGLGGPYEKQYFCKDGSRVWFLFVAADLGDGTICEYAVDISDRKKVEAALRASEARARELYDAAEAARVRAESAARAKDDFLASLSHELRTPLNPALLLASALNEDPALPPQIRSDMAVITRGITLQVRLVDDLLDITRITGGKLHLDLQPVDAHEALRESLKMVADDIEERSIRTSLDLAASGHMIMADAVRMQQVFWNIIANAAKFTPPDGTVTVRTLQPPHNNKVLAIEISDTGVGIAPEMLEKIFEPFAQESHDGAQRFGGLGLGLAITRQLVEMQHGRIEARSAGRGLGAVFRIEMPVTSLTQAAREIPHPPAASAKAPARRILLVEDHEMSRDTLTRLLERRGHTVFGAGTAAVARRLAAACGCDLVISDIGLPDGDGHTLMAGIRAAHGLPGIAISGFGAEDDLRRSEESGFHIHLTKPVNIRDLESAIKATPAFPAGRSAAPG
jgi:PAS domain S-box-containing protein